MGKLSTFSPSMLISNLNFRFAIPFRTNLAKYQPIRTDMGARAAILAFRSLNKLSTLVANYNVQNGLHEPCVYPSGPTQPNISPFGLILAL